LTERLNIDYTALWSDFIDDAHWMDRIKILLKAPRTDKVKAAKAHLNLLEKITPC